MRPIEAQPCPTCGTPLPANAPGGLCPKCLLAGAGRTSDGRQAGSSGIFEARSSAELQSVFPELEILALLGRGGMGAVYHARQPRLQRNVALKVLSCPPEHHDDFAMRFEREAQTLAQLNHPHIVTIHDYGERDGLFYIVMEFVDGTDLSQLIAGGELEPADALRIVPQICEALQYAHDKGITHRDIKPANILVDVAAQVKIADFGLAKAIGGDSENFATGLTRTGSAMGTPHYMAPEQWEAPDKVDHRSDIYALGVVFYEMLTGERPAGVFKPPSKKSPVDERLDTIVLHAMEKEPEQRYQQASEVRDDVTKLLDTPVRSKPRRKAVPAALGTAAVGASLLLLVYPPGGRNIPEKPDLADERTPLSVARLSEPGRLRVRGAFRDGQAVPLGNATAFDDFVQVIMNSSGWVGLRSDGTAVPCRGAPRVEKGVQRLLLECTMGYWGLIDGDNRLVIVGRPPEKPGLYESLSQGVLDIPEDVQRIGVADAAWRAGIAIARLRDGTTRVWGERYQSGFAGQEAWPQPPPDALQGVVDIAICHSACATVTGDGRLHVWNHETAGRTSGEVGASFAGARAVAVDGGWDGIRVLTDDGRVFGILDGRGWEGALIAEDVERIDGYLILKRDAAHWESRDPHADWDPIMNAALAEFGRIDPDRFAAVPIRPEAAAVWIESTD